MFDTLTIRRPRSIEFVKTALKTLVGAYLVIGLTAGYRAYYQIRNLQLNTEGQEIRAGSNISTEVVSYARVPITLKLELIQGGLVAELSTQVVRKNDWAFLILVRALLHKVWLSTPTCFAVFKQVPPGCEPPQSEGNSSHTLLRQLCGKFR